MISKLSEFIKNDLDNKRDNNKLTPMKAIRAKCLECSCYSRNEVDRCIIKDCYLWAFRYGKGPQAAKRKGKTVE